jgi:hypothetical protein
MSSLAQKIYAPTVDVEETPPQSQFLISAAVDLLLVGGLSIGMFFLISTLFKASAPDASVATFVYNCSFLVNFPHFLASYQLLYGDFRHEIFNRPRFFWAAVIVPGLLAGIMLIALFTEDAPVLSYVLNSMYFFVGWHYVKQIFGTIMVTNSLQNYFYQSHDKLVLKLNLFSIWAISFLTPNIGKNEYQQMGIKYASLEFPPWFLSIAYTSLALSAVAVVMLHIKKFLVEGRWPSKTAVVSMLAIYIWFIPMFSHPMFGHMIPFFHSLQYLLFVYTFRRNKTVAKVDLSSEKGRFQSLVGVWGYLLGSAVLGALAFHFIPNAVDSLRLVHAPALGPTPALFFFTVFINIHHYFIDNVLWRGNNPEMRKHLFGI